MKLTVNVQLSVDGVFQGNGGPHPDGGPDLALDLVEARAFPKGIVLQTYRPNGRPRYAPEPTKQGERTCQN